jgi:hypothetical protein
MWQNLKTRPRIIVRVVLQGEGKPRALDLHLLCKTCFPDPRVVTIPTKQILKKILDLPFDGVPRPAEESEPEEIAPPKVRTHRGSR